RSRNRTIGLSPAKCLRAFGCWQTVLPRNRASLARLQYVLMLGLARPLEPMLPMHSLTRFVSTPAISWSFLLLYSSRFFRDPTPVYRHEYAFNAAAKSLHCG